MTGQRIHYLYDLMDAPYDAAQIADHSRALGHMPVIDSNCRSDTDSKATREAESKPRILINMPDPDGALYNFRTMAERINARQRRVRRSIPARARRRQGALSSHVRSARLHRRSNPPYRSARTCANLIKHREVQKIALVTNFARGCND
jgi:hypothetical protein